MKRSWRMHSVAFIVEQIEWLKENYGINAVDYADDYLFGRPGPMKRLVETVNMPWSGQVRVGLLKPDFVNWMRETGCQGVNIGAESGSQRMLDIMTKDQDADHIERGVATLIKYASNIEANLSFIVGLPEERREDRKITFDLIERLADMSPNMRCSVCVYMPYPGTPLWPKALEAGYESPPTQEGWAAFDLNRGNTPWMDDGVARAMCDVNDILFVGRSQGHWLLKPYYGLLRWRWHNMYFDHYWEGALKQALINSPLKPLITWLTDRFVHFNQRTHKGAVSEGADVLGLEQA